MRYILIALLIILVFGAAVSSKAQNADPPDEDNTVYVVPIDPYYDPCIGCSEWMLKNSYPRGARPEDSIPLRRRNNIEANKARPDKFEPESERDVYNGYTSGSYINQVRRQLLEEGYTEEQVNKYIAEILGPKTSEQYYLEPDYNTNLNTPNDQTQVMENEQEEIPTQVWDEKQNTQFNKPKRLNEDLTSE